MDDRERLIARWERIVSVLFLVGWALFGAWLGYWIFLR